MPYITAESKRKLEMFNTSNHTYQTPGELNYFLTKECIRYISQKGSSYQTYNDVLGVLNAMSHEVYRRLIAPYEDQKCKENGDVF